MPAPHEVFNQPPPLVDYDVADDPALLDAMAREEAGWAVSDVRALGRLAGSAESREWGRLANEHPPRLHTHDRFGNRIDEVEFHPAWHSLMRVAVGHGLHAAPWASPRVGAHVARAAGFYVWGSTDAGHTCPISAGDGSYRLTGHKWFTSAPMSDLFFVLAQAPAGAGLSCFLLPRVNPDNGQNDLWFLRLKDKLGNRSNASAEVEYGEASAWLVGAEGRGIATIIDMVNMTRLDCVLGTATGMRSAVVAAAHHCHYRAAFGRLLIDQPAMANVLADLAVESEAATVVAFRLAGATDRAARGSESEVAFRRLALAATKYWVCKRAPGHAAEALECLGGNGYIEDSGMPRLYREAPLASIWEGSGNVAALDVVRVLARSPSSVSALLDELLLAAGADQRLDDAIARLRKELADPAEERARRLAEAIALCLQGALLVQHAPPAVADAFCASRLGGDWGHAYGTLPSSVDFAPIIERATPKT
jgi:putative acyl-CoA dehydrogenase